MIYQIILIFIETFSGCGKRLYEGGFTTESEKEEPENENIDLTNNVLEQDTLNDHNYLLE